MKTQISSIRIQITYPDGDGEKTVTSSVSRNVDLLPETAQLIQLRREAVSLVDHVASKLGLTHPTVEEPTVVNDPVAAAPRFRDPPPPATKRRKRK